MTGLASPAQVMERLQTIEHEIAEKQNDYEEAAFSFFTLAKQWHHREQVCMTMTKASNAEKRKAEAFVRAVEQDDLWDRLSEAQATYEAIKAWMKGAEQRATIGMSILRAQGRG